MAIRTLMSKGQVSLSSLFPGDDFVGPRGPPHPLCVPSGPSASLSTGRDTMIRISLKLGGAGVGHRML